MITPTQRIKPCQGDPCEICRASRGKSAWLIPLPCLGIAWYVLVVWVQDSIEGERPFRIRKPPLKFGLAFYWYFAPIGGPIMTDFISARCRFGADPWSKKDLITFFVIRGFLLACRVGPSTATLFSSHF
jgi:hypothetical protein